MGVVIRPITTPMSCSTAGRVVLDREDASGIPD
ncbi:hypothetical protein M768_10990 [Cellulosimicrobium cellulans F16]|uniref:Uncharacterized protein n=1 Tax=Cellulosimicrobium cellulans F16 TaxID=1350482 RepID=A0A0M0F7B7_CELCE|nr:hypothetical protein M768_10990 [Cellulosimicrobium cellulans F16]